jgi:hypothetical protein
MELVWGIEVVKSLASLSRDEDGKSCDMRTGCRKLSIWTDEGDRKVRIDGVLKTVTKKKRRNEWHERKGHHPSVMSVWYTR